MHQFLVMCYCYTSLQKGLTATVEQLGRLSLPVDDNTVWPHHLVKDHGELYGMNRIYTSHLCKQQGTE